MEILSLVEASECALNYHSLVYAMAEAQEAMINNLIERSRKGLASGVGSSIATALRCDLSFGAPELGL